MKRQLVDFDGIRAAATMAAVLDFYGIPVKNGLALCPFHPDRNPSMKVYRDGFYCFSCGTGGDVVKFVALKEGIRNGEAAVLVAKLCGIVCEDSYRAREQLRKAAQARRKQESEKADLKAAYDALCRKLRQLRAICEETEPFSDAWCEAVRQIPALEGEIHGVFEKLSGC